MKKGLAIVGILAVIFTPRISLSDHLEPRESEIKARGNLHHTNLRNAYLSDANLSGVNLSGADMSGVNMSGISTIIVSGCPSSLPNGWVCKQNTLINAD